MMTMNIDNYDDLAAVATWDDTERGYAATISHGDMVEIQRIDAIGKFEDDEEAAKAAVADGVPIIPVDELPENFEFRWLGWIDTPENRERIKRYCGG